MNGGGSGNGGGRNGQGNGCGRNNGNGPICFVADTLILISGEAGDTAQLAKTEVTDVGLRDQGRLDWLQVTIGLFLALGSCWMVWQEGKDKDEDEGARALGGMRADDPGSSTGPQDDEE